MIILTAAFRIPSPPVHDSSQPDGSLPPLSPPSFDVSHLTAFAVSNPRSLYMALHDRGNRFLLCPCISLFPPTFAVRARIHGALWPIRRSPARAHIRASPVRWCVESHAILISWSAAPLIALLISSSLIIAQQACGGDGCAGTVRTMPGRDKPAKHGTNREWSSSTTFPCSFNPPRTTVITRHRCRGSTNPGHCHKVTTLAERKHMCLHPPSGIISVNFLVSHRRLESRIGRNMKVVLQMHSEMPSQCLFSLIQRLFSVLLV
ncbi:hypothetical protein BKA56DRAFT_97190 [Ilyonectria sp. MPI-CAGE-AT-0026]|nr:hypothetical protein BKA56DRAFT_97190 [Ilyonectria sp. MPI-CAGE-AT-0026]